MDTINELIEHVEDVIGGEVINLGPHKELLLIIRNEDFDEDQIYDFLTNWSGKYSASEDVEEYEDIEESVIIYTGLTVDSDEESIIPFESENEYTDNEEWDDETNGWLSDEEF